MRVRGHFTRQGRRSIAGLGSSPNRLRFSTRHLASLSQLVEEAASNPAKSRFESGDWHQFPLHRLRSYRFAGGGKGSAVEQSRDVLCRLCDSADERRCGFARFAEGPMCRFPCATESVSPMREGARAWWNW